MTAAVGGTLSTNKQTGGLFTAKIMSKTKSSADTDQTKLYTNCCIQTLEFMSNYTCIFLQ